MIVTKMEYFDDITLKYAKGNEETSSFETILLDAVI